MILPALIRRKVAKIFYPYAIVVNGQVSGETSDGTVTAASFISPFPLTLSVFRLRLRSLSNNNALTVYVYTIIIVSTAIFLSGFHRLVSKKTPLASATQIKQILSVNTTNRFRDVRERDGTVNFETVDVS